jgi:hypothetical protein
MRVIGLNCIPIQKVWRLLLVFDDVCDIGQIHIDLVPFNIKLYFEILDQYYILYEVCRGNWLNILDVRDRSIEVKTRGLFLAHVDLVI